ncbi:hypothetical protein KX816_04490 [Sphingosinicellaceae bacterium]|nr:hypothetical protein KX816_04490 [Sphingosinicellaceae bacterium]
MIHKQPLDRYVNTLVSLHGMGHGRIRRLLCCGLLPAIGEPSTSAHKAPSETSTGALQRMLDDGPAFTSREQFRDFRGKLAAGESLSGVILSKRRIREAAAVLLEEGEPLVVETVFQLAGGNRPQIGAALRLLALEWPGGLERAVMNAADLEPQHLAAMARSGLVPELSWDGKKRGLIDAAVLASDLRKRFYRWKPERFEFQQVIDLGVMRNGLRLGWADDNPAGVLDPLIDMMIRHQHNPTVHKVQTLASGGAAQIEAHLRARARSTGDVSLPHRLSRGKWREEDLRQALPPQMSDLFNTALDPVRGSPHDKLSLPKTGRIIENPHAQLQIIGAVVALHRPRASALLRSSDKAEQAASNLARGLAGIDVTNPALLAIGFDAIRLLLRGPMDPREVRQTLRHIDHWRFIIEVYDDYLATPGLPTATRAFLIRFRPVWPSGGQALFRQVKDELNAFARSSKAALDEKLQPFLKDVPGFVQGVLGVQVQLEGLRGHVRTQVAKEEKKGTEAVWPLHETFISSTPVGGGGMATDEYDYRVHRWIDVMGRIDAITDTFARPSVLYALDPFGGHPGAEQLFENRFVVELLGCRRDGVDVDYQIDVLRLHRDYGFWESRDLPDGEAYALRSARLAEFGLTPEIAAQTGGGIANFGRGKFIRARKARLLLGHFLFPIEEAYHSSLIGALQIAARAVEALRIGDLVQWNIGEGLETVLDETGRPFTVLSSVPKNHVEPRKSPLTSECEDLADKLLALASERFFQGGPIPVLKRANHNGKGPERERMLFCTREAGMAGSVINNNSRLLMGGNGGFQSHWCKYLWSKLRRSEGKSLDERRQGHGHKTERMAAYYDVLTPDENYRILQVLHEQAETRAAHRRGERDSPLPDPPLSDLRLEAGRLANDIVFLAARDATPQLKAARERLSLIEAKIRRAERAA